MLEPCSRRTTAGNHHLHVMRRPQQDVEHGSEPHHLLDVVQHHDPPGRRRDESASGPRLARCRRPRRSGPWPCACPRQSRASRRTLALLCQPVQRGERHGRLADPTDAHEAHHSLSELESCQHVVDELVPSDDQVGQWRQDGVARLRRGGRRRRCGRPVGQCVVQDLGLHLDEGRSGIDPQLVEQQSSSPTACVQREILLTAPVVRGGEAIHPRSSYG